MPKRTTEALEDQVEQLLKENDKLKAASGHPQTPVDSPSDPDTPRRSAWTSPRPRSLHVRVGLWTATSAHHLLTPINTRRTSLLLLILCSLTSLAIADPFWKTPHPKRPPRLRLTSGSRPMSRTRLASRSWRRSPLRSTRFSLTSRLTIWTPQIFAAL